MNVFKSAVTLLLAAALPVLSGFSASAQTINGAGASFPYPLYAQWAYAFNLESGIKINYQSIGSGGGIAQIKAKTIDFGASDAPLEKAELDADGLMQFPMVVGGVTPVVNLKETGSALLTISPDVLADIYLGTITKWNDPRIVALNAGIKLPDRAITVVHRADGSGTTWIFTNYLDAVSKQWHDKVGAGKAIQWPIGIGGKGNEGVATNVQRINGAIGYVEYAYALQNKLSSVKMKNKNGVVVEPTIASFQAAAANADWNNAPGFYMVLTNQPGAESWPITGASFILIHKNQTDAVKAQKMLTFFGWCFKNGGETAKKLHYVPMPKNVTDIIEKTWKESIKSNGVPVLK